jgi:hypothetical protein
MQSNKYIGGFISFPSSQNPKIKKILSQVRGVNELRNFVVEFVAYYFSQSRQLLESMIPPPWIGNREIKEFQQSRECLLETILISALLPIQRTLIFAADVTELLRNRHRMPTSSSEFGMVDFVCFHHIFRTKHLPGSALTKSRISKVSNAAVKSEIVSLL